MRFIHWFYIVFCIYFIYDCMATAYRDELRIVNNYSGLCFLIKIHQIKQGIQGYLNLILTTISGV